MPHFTQLEWYLLQAVCATYRNWSIRDIAAELNYATSSVYSILSRLYDKVNVDSREELTEWFDGFLGISMKDRTLILLSLIVLCAVAAVAVLSFDALSSYLVYTAHIQCLRLGENHGAICWVIK